MLESIEETAKFEEWYRDHQAEFLRLHNQQIAWRAYLEGRRIQAMKLLKIVPDPYITASGSCFLCGNIYSDGHSEDCLYRDRENYETLHRP